MPGVAVVALSVSNSELILFLRFTVPGHDRSGYGADAVSSIHPVGHVVCDARGERVLLAVALLR